MEQNQYEEETFDGMWMPVKFAAPIGHQDINDAIHYLATYEPKREGDIIDREEPEYREVEMVGDSIEEMFDQAAWQMTKAQIDTTKIENYLDDHGESEIEELIVRASSNKWHDAVLSMLAVSALTSSKNRQVT